MSQPLDDKTIKCIRCGFCLDACPTFRLTGQETRGPRGRIYLVRSWREGVIPFDTDVVEALDTCLGCRACETACPSGVEYGSILEMARAHIEESHLRPTAQTFARSQLLATLTNPGRLAASLKAAGLFGKLTGGKMPGFAAKLLSGSDNAAVSLPVPQGEAKVHTLPERSPAKGAKRYTVGILAGCVMRALWRHERCHRARTAGQRLRGCCAAVGRLLRRAPPAYRLSYRRLDACARPDRCLRPLHGRVRCHRRQLSGLRLDHEGVWRPAGRRPCLPR